MYWSPDPIRPPSPSLNGQEHAVEGAAVGGEHDAGAEVDDPDPGLLGRRGGGLPGHAHPGGEVVAGGRRLGELLGAPIAVVAHRRAREQHLRAGG